MDIEAIRKWNPCCDPTRYLAEDWQGSVLDILRMKDIPVEDRIWCGIMALNEKQQRLFACWCAREVQKLAPDHVDSRSVKAIEVAERYAHGEATGEELAEARSAMLFAASAARDEAWDAAWHAAWYAAAAYEAWVASAAWRVTRDMQLKRLIELIEGEQID